MKISRSSPALVGIAGLVVGAVLVLSQGSVDPAGGEGTESHAEPAHVVHAEGSEVATVTLTEEAAERIDLQTASVTEGLQADELIIPYSALLYDPEGKTWVYTSPEPLTFERAPVTVDTIDGDRVLVKDGPEPGTEVVTVGAAEVWGAEFGVGH